MGTRPNRNLPPESTPWGKWVEEQVSFLSDSAGRRSLDATNSSKAQNATTEALGEQIQALQGVVDTLQDTVDQVAALALNQVVPASGGSIVVNFTLGTSVTVLTSTGFTVPAGYTRAVVTGMGSVVAASSASGDRLFANVAIAGTPGADMGTVLTAASPWGNIACYGAQVLTGLTGGSTFTVDVRARLQTGPGSSLVDYAQVAATVLFLK